MDKPAGTSFHSAGLTVVFTICHNKMFYVFQLAIKIKRIIREIKEL
jgi:hypothetical protein